MLDRLIHGGTIVDGTGAGRFRGDIGIKDGQIVEIGKVTESAVETVDADGRVVAPGIIDMHTHLDAQVMWEPELTPSSLQGVTTAIGANCGFSIAPINEESADYIINMLACVEQMPAESLNAGLNVNWRSFAEWTSQIEGKSALNIGFLAAHNPIRRLVMGEDWQRPAYQAEVDKMAQLVDETLAAGALGFSTSWSDVHGDHNGDPVPSRFAGQEELVQLSAVLRNYPGTFLGFAPGSRPHFSVEGVRTMAEMSIAARARLNWNVLTIGVGVPEATIRERVATSDYAAQRGGQVFAVLNARIMERQMLKPLTSLGFNALPEWPAVMALPVPERVIAFSDLNVRARLAHALVVQPLRNGFPRDHFVDHVENPNLRSVVGRSLEDLAKEQDSTPLDVFFDLCAADNFNVHFFRPNRDLEENYRLLAELWDDPRCVIGSSDAGAHIDSLDFFKMFLSVIGPNVRDRHLTTLERAVHLVTDRQARFNNLVGRGRLETGWQADIMIFDPETIDPGDTYLRPDYPAGVSRTYAEPIGMDRVMVNGVDIVVEGTPTGATPGTLLRSGRDLVPRGL